MCLQSELLLLHGLLNQLESQSTLVVTFVPDKGSADDFLFQRNKQKLIKADEKRRQMEEAAEILRGIHASLEAQVKTERTFYRELIGLSRFHSVQLRMPPCIHDVTFPLGSHSTDDSESLSSRLVRQERLECRPALRAPPRRPPTRLGGASLYQQQRSSAVPVRSGEGGRHRRAMQGTSAKGVQRHRRGVERLPGGVQEANGGGRQSEEDDRSAKKTPSQSS